MGGQPPFQPPTPGLARPEAVARSLRRTGEVAREAADAAEAGDVTLLRDRVQALVALAEACEAQAARLTTDA